MLHYETQFLQIDNFDILLLVQMIGNIQEDPNLMKNDDLLQKAMQQAKQLDALVLKNLDRMSIHEFVTISHFYLSYLSEGICSKTLAESFLEKIVDSVTEFNELQL